MDRDPSSPIRGPHESQQHQQLYNQAPPSQYTTFPEVAASSPYSAPEVDYYSAPETVPPQYYTAPNQHATSDQSPTVYGSATEDKHVVDNVYQHQPMAPPTGPEPSVELAEKPTAMKKKKTIWILVAIAILLVIGAAVGGGVGGTMAARNKAAAEASQNSAQDSGQSSSISTSQSSSTPTSQSSSTSTGQSSTVSTRPSPLPTGPPGTVCIEGTGEGNFAGLCSFACHYGYVPSPCTCTAWGTQVQPPPATGQKGYPRADVPDRCSYLGLCSFAWDRGYTDNLAACSPDPAGAVGCA